MKTIIFLTLLGLTVAGWAPGCASWSCRRVASRCWEPSCGVLEYSRNIDYFVYWFKDPLPEMQAEIDANEAEIASLKAESAEQWAELSSELEEANKRQEFFENKTNAEISNLRTELADAKNELEKTQSELAETKNEVATLWSKLNAQNDDLQSYKAKNNARVSDLEELNEDLQSDVANLRAFVKKNARDNLRYLVLYPKGCSGRCVRGYKRWYGYWSTISVKLASAWRITYRHAPCWRRRSGLRRLFIRLCRPYGTVVYRRLLPYYNYIWGDKVCDSSFFVGASA